MKKIVASLVLCMAVIAANSLIVNRPIVHLLVLAHNYNLNIFDTNI